MNICGCKECDLPVLALGMCNKHWRRTKIYGSPFVLTTHSGSMRGMSAEQRFNKQHKKSDKCWNWTSTTDKYGYGMFRGIAHSVSYVRAHRYSWALHNGMAIPKGMLVCHSCDNRKCVNPAHLWLGTDADNSRDKHIKGRANSPYGEMSPHAKLNESQVREILADIRPHSQLAEQYNVTTMTISDIKCRRSWAHLDIEFVAKGKKRGSRTGVSDKLTPDIVREIRSSPASGKDLAAKYEISPQLVCGIRKRRNWAHIE